MRFFINDKLRAIKYVVLGIYFCLVIWITLFNGRISSEHRMMLTPFWELLNGVYGIRRAFFIKQIVCNVLMFIPLGVMLPVLFMCNLKKSILCAVIFSMLIEVAHFISGRGLMETDDVINNTFGAVVGFILYCLIKKVRIRR